jgi:hypothetical protein
MYFSCEKNYFDLLKKGYYIYKESNVEYNRAFEAFLKIYRKRIPPH